LPSGPVGLPAKWAVTSNVEVGQTTYRRDKGRVGREERVGTEGHSHKDGEPEGGSAIGEGAPN